MIFLLFLVIIYLLISSNERFEQENHIKTLVRQTARWAVASEQDKNPLIKVLHANYSAGYLWALLDIAKPSKIEEIMGIDFDKFKGKIMEIQDKATKEASRKCPNFSPQSYLAKIGGEA
jgi:hypothetical protein